jgi:hypothetical protein
MAKLIKKNDSIKLKNPIYIYPTNYIIAVKRIRAPRGTSSFDLGCLWDKIYTNIYNHGAIY